MDSVFRIYAGLAFNRRPVSSDGLSIGGFKLSIDGIYCSLDFYLCEIEHLLDYPIVEICLKEPTQETLDAIRCISSYQLNNISQICNIEIEMEESSDLIFKGIGYMSIIFPYTHEQINISDSVLKSFNESLLVTH